MLGASSFAMLGGSSLMLGGSSVTKAYMEQTTKCMV